MKVKIGNKIYDSEIEPIMIILNNKDKENIKAMSSEATKYASFPKGYDLSFINKFMD